MRRGRAWRTWHWVALVGGSVAGLVAVAFLLDAMPRLAAPLIPAAWENRFGDLVETVLLHNRRTCEGAAGQRALENLSPGCVRRAVSNRSCALRCWTIGW